MRLPFLLRKNFAERLHLNPLEHALNRIRIVLCESPRGILAVEIGENQTPAAICKRSGNDDLAGLHQRAEIFEMRGTHSRPQSCAVRTVVTDDYEKHQMWPLRAGF